uniref:Si:ch211-207n23.2 n=1 Tax=Astyanax mexicanus TaxID=7994 RepID=A0A3B1J650_ASTMX
MKLLVCALVLVLVCSHSLKCFTCVNGNCKTATECPESSNFCKTSRTCEEFCVPGVNIYCCQEDLCG